MRITVEKAYQYSLLYRRRGSEEYRIGLFMHATASLLCEMACAAAAMSAEIGIGDALGATGNDHDLTQPYARLP